MPRRHRARHAATTGTGVALAMPTRAAVAVTTRCDGCIAFHAAEAKKLGVTTEEVSEALGVAINMNAGAALVYSTHVLDAFDKS